MLAIIFDVIWKLTNSFANNLNVIKTSLYNHEIRGKIFK